MAENRPAALVTGSATGIGRAEAVALAEAGYRAVAPYTRGYAPTDVPPRGPYHAAAQVQDAVAFADSSPMPEPSTLLEDVYA